MSAASRKRTGAPLPSSEEARRRMLAVRRRGTMAELRLRSELHGLGLRYRVHRRLLTASRSEADIAFGPARVAIFVDGCFWHCCPQHASHPKAHSAWWREKLKTNVERDRRIDHLLGEAGWEVIRIWEHENPKEAALLIQDLVRRRVVALRAKQRNGHP